MFLSSRNLRVFSDNSMQHKLYHFILEQEETLEIIVVQSPLHPQEKNVILI